MLAYAPRPDQKKLRPATLGLIVLGHAGLLALVMTAKSGFIFPHKPNPPDIVFVPNPKSPTTPPPQPPTDTRPSTSQIDTVDPIVPPIPQPGATVDPLPQPLPDPGPVIGNGTAPIVEPAAFDPPIVRTGPRFATVGDAVRPPYPDSMRQSGDEASLRLRLTIDERGRVIAVEAVGPANPTFLAAARRHILRMWRYQPAMEGAKAVPSTTTITLKFELGNA